MRAGAGAAGVRRLDDGRTTGPSSCRDILIARFQSNFKRPIDSAAFTGEVSFAEFRQTNRSRPVQLIDMPWRFWDEAGGYAEGEVRMALVEPPGMNLRAA